MSTSVHSWLSPPDKLILSKNDVHVWRAALDNPSLPVQEFFQVLSDDERRKAERFCFDRDKKRFIVGRGVLRTIIGKYYLSIESSRLEFAYGSLGKPFLAKNFGDDRLRFNQADSHELALYAFTKDCEVGIDVEYMRYIPDAQQIIDSSCSEYEKGAFNELPEREKQEAFFNCWTRKEAYIKAIGKGLYYPLDQFSVSLGPGEPVRLLDVKGDPGEACRWSLEALIPAPGYVAALAVEEHDWSLSCWQFPGEKLWFR